MANKEETFWCKVYITESHWPLDWVVIDNNEDWIDIWREDKMMTKELNNPHIEIIWHPVMIGDVIDWIEPYWKGYAQDVKFSQERKRKINIVLLQWDKKRESIETQSDECIDYVYSLIKK